jgi:predicted component of type VI protein secretion system
MTPSALIVEVANTDRGERQEYAFARSPIRVGRSQLNDLPLEHGFVSHCHGLFHFDASRVEFVDVGSTNGSYVGGQRLHKNRRVTLSASSAVAIGTLRIRAHVERRDSAETRASYAFRPLASQASKADLASSVPASVPSFAHSRADDPLAEAGLTGPEALRSTLLQQRFAQSFLELRRGQHQLLRGLGLSVPSSDKLHTLDTAGDLLAYLLDPSAPSARLDELSRAYAELMMHEVALVSALGAGARDLLDELSPANLAPRGMGGIASWLSRVFGHDARWRLLEKKSDELHEETALSSVVLGRSFARAYAAAMGKSSELVHAEHKAERRAHSEAESR